MELGILTLLPPIVILIVAIKTRSTTSSLLIGVIVCCVLQYGKGFLGGLVDLMYGVACSEDTAWYVMFVILFGCLLGIWSRTGATNALAEMLSKYATTKRRTLLLTWVIGALVFIDDFTSIAVRGTITGLYDKNNIPRTQLSYMTDATGSPLNALIPIGTWGLFYASVFNGYEEITAYGDGVAVYTKLVPFLFYSWVAIAIALLFALGIVKPIGGLKKAQEIANETGKLYSDASLALNSADEDIAVIDSAKVKKLVVGLFGPLIAFIAVVLINGDVITGSWIAIAVALVLFLIFRLATWKELMSACMGGAGDMLPMVLIVFAAYMVRDSLIGLGMPEYVTMVCEPFMNAAILPVLTFVMCAVLAFLSGTNWGSGLPVAAVVIPLAPAVGANMFLVLAAVVSGAAFGAHACFYCDVTVFTSGMTKIDNMEHAVAQLPLCIIGGIISAVLFLAAGIIL